MTTPRAHAYMAKLFYSDKEMQCWRWGGEVWVKEDRPSFYSESIYHVGKTAPTEPPPPMCELAGVKFPMPAQEKLTYRQLYFLPVVSDPDNTIKEAWDNTLFDEKYLKGDLIQLTREGAIQQAKAMRAALNQAVEKAKEKMNE